MRWVVGIDVGGTLTKFGLVNTKGSVKKFSHEPTPSKPREFRKLLIKKLTGLMKIEKVGGIGIGMPGLIDYKKNKVVYLPHLSNLKNINISSFLKHEFDCQVAMDNDAHSQLIGMLFFEKKYKHKTIVLLTLGTGTGSAFAIKGKVYGGNHISSAGWGEAILNYDGKRCTCGRIGCLNAYTGETNRIIDLGFDTAEAVREARRGNSRSLASFDRLGKALGIGCANIINILRPDRLVFSGGCLPAFPYIEKSFYRYLSSNIFGMANTLKNTKVDLLKTGVKSGVRGAGAMILAGKTIYLSR